MTPRQGRKPLLENEELIETLLNWLRLGLPNNEALQLAGIGTSTYYVWMQKAQDLETKKTPTKRDLLYLDFRDSVKKAEIESKAFHLRNIRDAGLGEGNYDKPAWQASAWFLERRYPEQYGRRERIEHITVEMVDQEIERLERELGR